MRCAQCRRKSRPSSFFDRFLLLPFLSASSSSAAGFPSSSEPRQQQEVWTDQCPSPAELQGPTSTRTTSLTGRDPYRPCLTLLGVLELHDDLCAHVLLVR